MPVILITEIPMPGFRPQAETFILEMLLQAHHIMTLPRRIKLYNMNTDMLSFMMYKAGYNPKAVKREPLVKGLRIIGPAATPGVQSLGIILALPGIWIIRR